MLLSNFLKGVVNSKYMKTKDATGKSKEFIEQLQIQWIEAMKKGDLSEMARLKQAIEIAQKEIGTTEDAINSNIYYEMIVAEARNRKDPRLTREVVRPIIEHLLQKYDVPFDEAKFNQAFHEFRQANANRMVYRNA